MDIKTATPAQIDTEIARLEGEFVRAQQTIERYTDFLNQRANADDYEREHFSWFSQAKADEAQAAIDAATVTMDAAREALYPLTAEFADRGGWTRFYLVTNTGGHIHHTTGCASCFPTTQFAWLTDYSGTEHADLVEEAGSKACTVCFPDAPVEVLSRESRIKYESAEVKARREEREAKRAAAAAAEVVVEGYVEYASLNTSRPRTKTFKTARAVTNDIASNLTSLCWYGMEHPTSEQWAANVEACRKALVTKGVDYDYEKALTAARKKVTREGCQPKF